MNGMPTEAEIQKIIDKAVTETRADSAHHLESLKEFHRDEMKVMREYIDGRFESMQSYMDDRFDRVEGRLTTLETEMVQVKSALQMLLEEFKKHREEVDTLKKEVTDLRARLEILEAKVLHST